MAERVDAILSAAGTHPTREFSMPAALPSLHVLLVDDHAVLRDGVAQLVLRLRPGSMFRHAANAEQARALLAARPEVDLVVLDVHLPGGAPLQLLRELRAAYPLLPVAMLSADTDPALATEALRLGAAGYLPKGADTAQLANALGVVLDGGCYVPAFVAQRSREPAGETLSERQQAVFALLVQGHANKEIARMLGLAEPTIKAHLVTIYRVLKVKNRAQAVLAASASLKV
jgi:DNA-binding NarL/FixJ family response regulator